MKRSLLYVTVLLILLACGVLGRYAYGSVNPDFDYSGSGDFEYDGDVDGRDQAEFAAGLNQTKNVVRRKG
jgi:hypothetical protein